MGGKDDGDTGSSDNGFTKGDHGSLRGNPTGGSFHEHDYNSWDWKHIEAAIVGLGGGVSSAENLEYAKSVADPQSLQDAADTFYQVQLVFAGVSQALTDQANALAGKDGVWTGDAADAFTEMIKTFSKQVGAVADVISGGHSGKHSVPQQLANNAVNLTNAQNKILEIDNWYAKQAHDALHLHAMSGTGLIPVSQKPELVEMMNHDMRQVLKSLAGEYQVTLDAVTSPGGINSPLGGGGTGQDQPKPPDLSDLTSLDGEDHKPGIEPVTLSSLPELSNPAGTDLAGKLRLNGLGPDPTGEKPELTAFKAGTSTAGAGTLDGPPTAFPDLTAGTPAGDVNGLKAGLAPFPDGTGTDGLGGLGGLDSASLAPPGADPFTGGTGTGGTGGLNGLSPLPTLGTGGLGTPAPLPGAFPGGTGVGGTGGLGSGDGLSTADPDTWGSTPAPVPFTGGLGTGGTGKLGSGLTGLKPSAFPGGLDTGATGGLGSGLTGGLPVGFPGDLSTSSGLPADLSGGSSIPGLSGLGEAGTAFPGGLGTGGAGGLAGAGMPFLPNTGGGQAPPVSSERSDASGLLDHDAKPWAGSTDVGDDMATHLGTTTGGEGLTLPVGAGTAHEATAPAEGMPYLPGMGGGAQAPPVSSERSDASGLLDHDAKPWAGSTDVGDDMATHLGTTTGGEGLTLPVGAGTAHEATAPAEGMPYLPGMGGGAQAPAVNSERSDASGLLENDAEPWTGAADGETAESGTAAGGEGLALPFFPTPVGSEREQRDDRREAAAAALLAGEAAAVWAEGVAVPGTGTEAQKTAEATVGTPAAELATAALPSATISLPEVVGDEESGAAWDVAGAAFVPLLWAASAEDEADVTADGPATAEEGTWGTVAAEPAFTTWQPSRASEAAATPAAVELAGAALSCAGDDIAPEPEEEPAEAEEEEAPARGAADLLVQERELWGTSDSEGLGAII
ncbi:WXG100 family type VII secretion target [Kitasatospora sp. NPDC058190]|uniref:WXG100 family type VII secretion target n=1 Tax=Kitasatospora sp. NPDC058190 TaxID=3346371 RepID=UPI0036D8A98F